VLSNRLREALFAGSSDAHDALGSRPSFGATTAAILKMFHDTWYGPNNAVLRRKRRRSAGDACERAADVWIDAG
jgi:hypothetical protein